MYIYGEGYEDTAILPERFEALTLGDMVPVSVVGVDPERLIVDASRKCFLDLRGQIKEKPDDGMIWVFRFEDGWYVDLHELNRTFTTVSVEEEHPDGETYLAKIKKIISDRRGVLLLAQKFKDATQKEAYPVDYLSRLKLEEEQRNINKQKSN